MGGSEDRTEQAIEFNTLSRQLSESLIIYRPLKKWYRISLITRVGYSNLTAAIFCSLLLISVVRILIIEASDYFFEILFAIGLILVISVWIWLPLNGSTSLNGYVKRFEEDLVSLRDRIDRYLSVKDLSCQTFNDLMGSSIDGENILIIIESQDGIRISILEYGGTVVHIGPVLRRTSKMIRDLRRAIDERTG